MMADASKAADPAVLCLGEIDPAAVRRLLAGYGLRLDILPAASSIPGSFWGAPEAGLVGDRLLARPDTPLHSVLHEACHYICMSPQRRAILDTDAGGDHAEENGVCYLQVLLADAIPELGRARMLADMDRWGYSFRLGSARRWFEQDAMDAAAWLRHYGIIDAAGRPTGARREAPDREEPSSENTNKTIG